jgi:hypothetical protein
MRVWDVPPQELCRVHLLGEHRKPHAIWTILTQDKIGFRNHPETKRWAGKQAALLLRHEDLAGEMTRRGHSHRSESEAKLAVGNQAQTEFVHPVERQRQLLAAKPCDCYKTVNDANA